MTTIPTDNRPTRDHKCAPRTVVWAGLTTAANDATPVPLTAREGELMSMQVTGTFDSASITLLGSNDGVNWVAITDYLGSAAALTGAGIAELRTSCLFVKPNSASGAGSDDITVTLVIRA